MGARAPVPSPIRSKVEPRDGVSFAVSFDYPNRAELAARLYMSESTIDGLVLRGVIPEPCVKKKGEWFWDWRRVDRRLQDCPTIGTIYVVGFGCYVKIGFTSGPIEYRLVGIQTGAPEKLTVVAQFDGTVPQERALHRRFSAHRSYGEWVHREGELAAWIDAGCPP